MQTITAFFEAKAAYFSEGDFDGICSSNVFPTTLNLNGTVLPILVKDEMVSLLNGYRSSLMESGYAYSGAEILWSVSNATATTTVGIKWRNFDANGGEISQVDVVYHCKFVDDQWRVIMVDCNATPKFGVHQLV